MTQAMNQARLHGGDLSVVKADGRRWLDLSTGINPTSYPWRETLEASELDAAAQALPQAAAATDAVNAFCSYAGAPNPKEWLIGPGSQALIEALPMLFSPDQPVIIPHPTYSEHAYAWRRKGYDVWTPHQLPRKFADRSVVIVTNPNNPDGRIQDPSVLLALADTLGQVDGFLIVDEAFIDLYPHLSLARHELPHNIILLRSFGKFFGLAGLRLGLMRCAAPQRETVNALLPLWATSGIALHIAAKAYGDTAWSDAMRDHLSARMTALRHVLVGAGLEHVGSTDLYCLVRHRRAQPLFHHLQARAIHVRRFEYDDSWLRFGLAPEGGLSHLETALKGDWTNDRKQ